MRAKRTLLVAVGDCVFRRERGRRERALGFLVRGRTEGDTFLSA